MTVTPIGSEDGGPDRLAAWSAQLARSASARAGALAGPTDNLVQMHQQGMQREPASAPGAGSGATGTGTGTGPGTTANPGSQAPATPAAGTPLATSAADRARPAGLINAPVVTVAADAGARPGGPGWAGPRAGATPGGVVGASTTNVAVLVTAPRTDGVVRDAPGLAQMRAGLPIAAIGIVAVANASASGDAGLDDDEDDDDDRRDRRRGGEDTPASGPGRGWGASQSGGPGHRGGRVDLSG